MNFFRALLPLLALGAVSITVAVAWGCDSRSQPALLPAPISKLKIEIQGKKPQEVSQLIVKTFGPPARSIGSGLYIPQWDVAGGTLTFHPLRGPSFRVAGGLDLPLIDTHNPIGENLPGNYEMTSLPDPANHNNRFWLGNLILTADGKYRFNPANAGTAPTGFFPNRPAGHYVIDYPKAVRPTDLLESLPDRAVVAQVSFVADADPTQKLTLELRSDIPDRLLSLTPPLGTPQHELLEKSWLRFWE